MSDSILIVEDEAITALDIKFQLEDNGYVVFIADNAADAFTCCDEEDVDLVVADINIKGDVNGIEMAEKISEMGIRVIFLSANPNNIPITLSNDEKPLYIKKPINIHDFTRIIDSLLK